MRKRLAGIAAAAAVGICACFGFGAPVSAETGVKVTYHTPFFKDVVREVAEYSAPENLTIGEICEAMYGFPEHKLSTDGIAVEWYADASYTTKYGFDEAVTSSMTLYGKVVETETYTVKNGTGWDLQNGRTYAGDPIRDNYITSNEYLSPSYADPATGDASFFFEGIKYGVYARGLSVSSPFEVTFDFTNIQPDGQTCWFGFSLFPALTLAQFSVQTPWANAGAASSMVFNLGTDPVGIQPMNAGSSVMGRESTTQTDWAEGGAVLQSLLSEGKTELPLTVEIGESGTTFRAGEKVVATSPAKRSDFPSGYAYLHFATNGSQALKLGVDVSVRQTSGTFTGAGDAHARISDIEVNGMSVTAKIELDEGYELAEVRANGVPAKAVKLYNEENRYALDLAGWQTGDVTLSVSSKKEGGAESGGCGGCGKSGETGAAAVLAIAALCGVCLKLK